MIGGAEMPCACTWDRWAWTVAALTGESLPGLPDLPGHRHVAAGGSLALQAAARDRCHAPGQRRASTWAWSTSRANQR